MGSRRYTAHRLVIATTKMPAFGMEQRHAGEWSGPARPIQTVLLKSAQLRLLPGMTVL